jgi:hypothetical protein
MMALKNFVIFLRDEKEERAGRLEEGQAIQDMKKVACEENRCRLALNSSESIEGEI